MNHYDLDLAALTMGEVAQTAGLSSQLCEAQGGVWSDIFGCMEADTEPGGFFENDNGGGGGGSNGIRIERTEIAFAVGGAAVIAAAIYFWRR